MIVDITDDSGKRVVIGDIVRQVFYKKIKGSKHIYHKLDAIGIDALAFKGVIESTCNLIKVLDTETMTLYEVTPQRMKQYGEHKHHKPHRAQLLLPRSYWIVTKNYPSKKTT